MWFTIACNCSFNLFTSLLTCSASASSDASPGIIVELCEEEIEQNRLNGKKGR